MPNVFLNGVKTDGYNWHNYWTTGYEAWASCDPNTSPHGQHVALYFPSQMLTNMGSKPKNITEADLASPPSVPGGQFGALTNKDEQGGLTAANSLNSFINAEVIAERVAVWTLNVTDGSEDGIEQNWHEAYRCNDYPNPYGLRPGEREWFTRWWTGSPGTFASCYKLYLPASIKNHPEELIRNGDFSSGTSYWTYSRTNCPYPLVATHLEGQPAARLGHCNLNTDELYQTITIPSYAATARMTYRIYIESSNATGPADYLYIRIRNSLGQVLQTLNTLNDTSAYPKAIWLTYSHDLMAYKGQTIQVYFKTQLGDLVATKFWLDDVSVQITR
jgi:hypothetical protein